MIRASGVFFHNDLPGPPEGPGTSTTIAAFLEATAALDRRRLLSEFPDDALVSGQLCGSMTQPALRANCGSRRQIQRRCRQGRNAPGPSPSDSVVPPILATIPLAAASWHSSTTDQSAKARPRRSVYCMFCVRPPPHGIEYEQTNSGRIMEAPPGKICRMLCRRLFPWFGESFLSNARH